MSADAFYTRTELLDAGFVHVGENVQVSRKAAFYGCQGARIGDRSRIDDFVILKGRVDIGSYVHISSFVMISGIAGQVTFRDCTTIGCGVYVYTSSDDFRTPVLNNPTVPDEFKHVITGPVEFGAGTIIGPNCVVLPRTSIGDGTSIGALSLIRGRIPEGQVLVSNVASGLILRGTRDVAEIRAKVKAVLSGTAAVPRPSSHNT